MYYLVNIELLKKWYTSNGVETLNIRTAFMHQKTALTTQTATNAVCQSTTVHSSGYKYANMYKH